MYIKVCETVHSILVFPQITLLVLLYSVNQLKYRVYHDLSVYFFFAILKETSQYNRMISQPFIH